MLLSCVDSGRTRQQIRKQLWPALVQVSRYINTPSDMQRIPETQMTLLLVGKDLLLQGLSLNIEDKKVPGIYDYLYYLLICKLCCSVVRFYLKWFMPLQSLLRSDLASGTWALLEIHHELVTLVFWAGGFKSYLFFPNQGRWSNLANISNIFSNGLKTPTSVYLCLRFFSPKLRHFRLNKLVNQDF